MAKRGPGRPRLSKAEKERRAKTRARKAKTASRGAKKRAKKKAAKKTASRGVSKKAKKRGRPKGSGKTRARATVAVADGSIAERKAAILRELKELEQAETALSKVQGRVEKLAERRAKHAAAIEEIDVETTALLAEAGASTPAGASDAVLARPRARGLLRVLSSAMTANKVYGVDELIALAAENGWTSNAQNVPAVFEGQMGQDDRFEKVERGRWMLADATKADAASEESEEVAEVASGDSDGADFDPVSETEGEYEEVEPELADVGGEPDEG